MISWTMIACIGCGAATSARTSDDAPPVVASSESARQPYATGEHGTDEAPTLPAAIDSPGAVAQSSDAPAPPVINRVPEVPPEPPKTGSDRGAGRVCLQYEPEQVVLRGVIQRVTFPGPPNYESVAQGDVPETCWLIKLDQPACVDGSPGDELNVAHSKVQSVQLVLDGAGYDRYRNLMGQSVEALGKLFGSHTGHHHTEVLLTVGELRPASRGRK